ncbi:MAG: hypothetical protein QM820_05920 [Minicystis sp.]
MNRVFSALVLSSIVACALALPACTAEVVDDEEETSDPIAPAPVAKTEGIVVPQHPGRLEGGAATAATDASAK